MSTTGVSTRSSRLNSREPSSKAASRKLRSKKIITTNKSSQKINISAKDKSLHVSKTNISANNSLPLSRRLRSRRNKKNYCEDSKLLQQYIPLKQRDSSVIIEKLNLKDNKKVPVYKAMKSFEKSVENKNDVYDFMFDINDTREKTTKKKQKKKINKKKDKTTKKTTRKKVTIQSKIINNQENKSFELSTNPMKPTQNNPSDSAIGLIVTESTKEDKKTEVPRTDTNIQIVEESVKEDTMSKIASSNINTDIQGGRESMEENIEKKIPKIISVENADNITVIKSSPNIEPFRPKNIFDNKTSIKQQNNTLNCSLLTKSLSPILKTSTLDLGSPWRPPTLPMFSRSKHFIQSTPKLRLENNKENMEMNKENIEINKENIKNKENIEEDKENMEMNKKNKCGREKEKKKKTTFHKKHNIIRKNLPTNQTSENVQAINTNKHVVQAPAVPARISLGEIKNLLQTKPDINDNKQASNQEHVEVDKSLTEKQEDKNVVNFLNFSDTFDVLSETERLSNFGTEIPLFMDLEPSHFSKPPQHSYKRKRAVNFDLSEDSGEEEKEEKKNVKHHIKKKKSTKSAKENEKRINEWIKTINSTFEEIDEYNLFIE
ncbi:uncharacterized protein LOC112637556 [Camponotus floridanus]|nr:uncharacterized protein LOC112637556 [Camponotus floridanus]XP_025263361.1 uncharacterized protein LOC112637556 [Camponotus floridanus]